MRSPSIFSLSQFTQIKDCTQAKFVSFVSFRKLEEVNKIRMIGVTSKVGYFSLQFFSGEGEGGW